MGVPELSSDHHTPSDRPQIPDLGLLMGRIQDAYQQGRNILSFGEYFETVRQNPALHLRSAAQYTVDMIESFGIEKLSRPIGNTRSYGLFDAPFNRGEGRVIGQEHVLENLHHLLANFARQGRTNRLILLHGPNGSAKSSIVRCLMAGLEAYASQPEGILYGFNWIFPTDNAGSERIGFGGGSASHLDTSSYAHLHADAIDARVPCELKDHPMFLLPPDERLEVLKALLPDGTGGTTAPDYLRRGDLSQKNRQIYDALLAFYQGDLSRVFQHVQVERIYLSHRYRKGAVTIEPQMSVDAKLQQITADRTMAQLPIAMQHLSLFTPSGPLVDANRGVLEFSDLLKRPVEAFKYLLGTIETNTVSMDSFQLHLDMVFIGSSNETYLDAFKQHPDFPSFKGRMELVQVPYLLQYSGEKKVYDMHVKERIVGRHIAPHATEIAARWAVLTRLRRNDPARYPKEVGEVIDGLTPAEKMKLYDEANVPKRLTTRQAKELRHFLGHIADEGQSYTNYEGRFGASAREMVTALMNAAHHSDYDTLHPLAVLDEIREILRAKSVHAFLKQEPVKGFHDHTAFLQRVEEDYAEIIDSEVRTASGLADEESYGELFERYIMHVTHWVKGSRVEDPQTGQLHDPDGRLMKRIEEVLVEGGEDPEEFRRALISTVGAKALENEGKAPPAAEIFSDYIDHLKEDFYTKRRGVLRKRLSNVLKLFDDEEKSQLEKREREDAETMLKRLCQQFNYTDSSAKDMIAYLLVQRYAEH